ncbi:MAG: anhydro-N-acetylmuramic acid kinase [Candidatus Limnocylindrales bacterium]
MRVIGMISGTSADAIEAVCCQIDGAPPRLQIKVLLARTTPIPPDLQRRIHAAATIEGSDVESITLLDAELGERFAEAARSVAHEMGLSSDHIDLIGSHGQTVWHAVRDDGSVAGSLQIGNGARVAERTGVTTVSDLRSRDIAAGGQGAPIVAYVDWLLSRHESRYRAVQNLGGIGNVAFLPPLADEATPPLAFDTGPANVLIDLLMTLITDGAASYDKDGAAAAAGTVDEPWVAELLTQPYFELAPPKTTGRELFSPAMARELLETGRKRGRSDADIVATVTAFSADSVADAYRRFLPRSPDEVIGAGGGTRNPVFMARLAAALPGTHVLTYEDLGYASQAKEAMAMAVLAYETWHGRPGTLPAFTGASHAVPMGAIHLGRRRPG